MKLLVHRDDLHHGGFAGLTEHRIVMDTKAFGIHKEPTALDGLGSFIYMADARFQPHGETRMHPHKEVDVISVMLEGRIRHEGSLGDGTVIGTDEIQVQRAGKEGFSHNEVNPDEQSNRMIQLWFSPQVIDAKGAYHHYPKPDEKIFRVYGGYKDARFSSTTVMDIITLKKDEHFEFTGKFQAYMIKGSAKEYDLVLEDGDFFSDALLELTALEACQFILIYLDKSS